MKTPRGSMIIFLSFLLAVNFALSQVPAYVDLTEDRVYTASETSSDILRNLGKTVTVTFYISQDLPADPLLFKTQIQDILNQYEDLARGKLVVEYEEPDNESATVQELAGKGIPQLQSEVVEKDKIEVKNFFFGAIVSAGEGDGEKREVLASVTSLEDFEYSLMSAVYSVSKDDKETVAFLKGHGEKDMTTDDLAKSYDIKNVNIAAEGDRKGFYIETEPAAQGAEDAKTEKIFVEPKTLVIAGPTGNLSEGEMAVLDDFIANGGRIVIMSEKINIDVEQGFMTKNIESNIGDFAKRYGIEINGDLVYDKSNSPISYTQQSYFGAFQMTRDYPFWVRAIKDNFSSHPSLAKIESLVFLWTSSLNIVGKDGYEVESLIDSTAAGESISGNITISPEANLSFLSGSRRTLAAISKAKGGEGQVIVIGDSDFASPAFMNPISDNEIFFTNLIDSISSSANLSLIRAKNISDRPIDNLADSDKNFWKFFAIFGGTIVLAAYGSMRIRKRRQKSRAA